MPDRIHQPGHCFGSEDGGRDTAGRGAVVGGGHSHGCHVAGRDRIGGCRQAEGSGGVGVAGLSAVGPRVGEAVVGGFAGRGSHGIGHFVCVVWVNDYR